MGRCYSAGGQCRSFDDVKRLYNLVDDTNFTLITPDTTD